MPAGKLEVSGADGSMHTLPRSSSFPKPQRDGRGWPAEHPLFHDAVWVIPYACAHAGPRSWVGQQEGERGICGAVFFLVKKRNGALPLLPSPAPARASHSARVC